ncbi:MAG: hypothetical protein GWN58_39345, partial [Anaerolineae bacterium]|nr:hypothetical protein [Anaerolineae bacterium]
KGANLGLVALGRGNRVDGYSTWDSTNKRWNAWAGLIGPSAGCGLRPVADSQHFYFHEYNTQDVWKVTNGLACTQISTGAITASQSVSAMAITDDYVYVYFPWVMEVWEISKLGTSETLIDEWEGRGETGLHALHPYITETNGKVYVATVNDDYTTVREITPSSAAGTGFGAEIGRIDGFVAEGFWSHQGTIFLTGRYRDPATERAVIYMQPGGAYGTLGEIRPGDDVHDSQGGGYRMLDHFFVTEHRDDTDNELTLFQVDSVSGGFAELAYDSGGALSNTTPE